VSGELVSKLDYSDLDTCVEWLACQPAILFSFDRSICEVIGSTLLKELVRAETEWKKDSPKWQRKMEQWEAWKGRAKERGREQARSSKARKGKQDDDVLAEPTELPDASWEASFQPEDPLPQFSFAGPGKYSRDELDADIKDLRRWSGVKDWILDALRRGIGIHHAGMNKAYRSLVERLVLLCFPRSKFIDQRLAVSSVRDSSVL
jgi:ATP-dependent RNA helicase DDX60